VDGKRLKGFKAAFVRNYGGSNPAVLLKYATKVGKFDFAAVYHEDIDAAVSSIAVPLPRTRVTAYSKVKVGDVIRTWCNLGRTAVKR
jgi:hypothetical protein